MGIVGTACQSVPLVGSPAAAPAQPGQPAQPAAGAGRAAHEYVRVELRMCGLGV
jgi:hypothetical protein